MLRVLKCLWIQAHPLMDSRVKRLVLWIQTLTLIVDEGSWIQVSVLHLSCAKAASLTPLATV